MEPRGLPNIDVDDIDEYDEHEGNEEVEKERKDYEFRRGNYATTIEFDKTHRVI